MQNDIGQALALLFSPGSIVELRAILDNGNMASGYYDDMAQLAADAEKVEGANAQGIYVTLNELDPALLARSSNRIKMRLGKKDPTTGDENITRRRWFPVDIDAVRASGVSSSDAEHTAALDKAARIAQYLKDEGWPEPIVGDSGNGAHLLYAIDMPNNAESTDLVKRGLEALALLFNDKLSTVDTANHNASRIWKLYGTVSRKGDSTKARPHRRSKLESFPDRVVPTSKEQLIQLAGTAKPITEAGGKKTSLAGQGIDLGRWLRDHLIDIADEKPYQGGILFALSECPFSGAHKDGAFAIQFPSGGIYAGCHHSSCGGGEQRWPELREKFEPRGDRKRTASVDKPPPPPGAPGSPSPLPVSDIPGSGDALAVLEHGDPKRAMLRTFAIDHEGDETVAECLILSLASRSILNTNGLHVSLTGESGKGKSHTFTTMLQQVPERFRVSGAMSNKALFYMEGLQPGMAIVLDDTSLSEDMAEILKGVTTSFRKPFMYRTVSKDRKGQVCIIPERCIWWVAKVEGAGDDQVFNRMLTCWIDDSPEQDDKVLARLLEKNTTNPDPGTPEHQDVIMCRAMWEILGQQRIHVVIPFATRIRFQAHDNRRNPDMLLDLIKANALVRFMQRERQDIGGVVCITATREDFDEAARLYDQLNGSSGGQTTKLTKKESDLVTTIDRSGWDEFTTPMLQKATGLSNGSIHRLIHGYSARGSTYTGLLEKCPAISFTDRTVVTDEDDRTGQSTRRRTTAYTFDRELYKRWCAGGAVWIDTNPDDHDDPSFNTSTAFNNPSTTVEGKDSEPDGPDSQSANDNTHMCVCTTPSFNKSQSMECVKTTAGTSPFSLCDPAIVEGQDPISSKNPLIGEPQSGIPGTSLQHPLKDRGEKPDFVEVLKDTIRATDYKLLDQVEYREPCYVCGKKGSQYVEKLTPGRKARKGSPARRVCKNCHLAAVTRDQASAPPLPGVIAIGRMVRISKDIGRCSVCNLGKAVFTDKEAGTSICQQCYDREARASGSAEGGAGP